MYQHIQSLGRKGWCTVVALVVTLFIFLSQSQYLMNYKVLYAPLQKQLYSTGEPPRDTTLGSSIGDITILVQRHAERRQHLHDVCEANRQRFRTDDGNASKLGFQDGNQFLVDDTHALVYCPVPKIGCSFWKRAFSILDGKNSHQRLFSISGIGIHTSKAFETFNKKSFLEKYYFLQSSAKFLFVRDPYERLFSGYIDKVFIPSSLTVTLALKPRNSPGSQDKKQSCASNATFEDFIRYVTKGVQINEHFHPANRKCFPCHVDYDFIGKMETFKEDAEFILTSVGVDPSSVFGSASSFEEENDLSIMRDVASRSFQYIMSQKGADACMSKYHQLQRMWVVFQIRGYLSINVTFPLTSSQADNTTLTQFQNHLQDAYRRSGDHNATKLQRQAAFMEAFYSVPRDLLRRLESYVKDDCDLFGYDCSIDSRFNVSNRPVAIFHFDRLLKMSDEDTPSVSGKDVQANRKVADNSAEKIQPNNATAEEK